MRAKATYTPMWRVFLTGAVRLCSQKSWLVAAIRNRMTRAARPNG
jgi:hypothetical protein